ncbi:hypothetical protein IW137_005478, partial [Coemansia sp. RSA 1287]
MLDGFYPSTTISMVALGLLGYFGLKRFMDGCRINVLSAGAKTSGIVRQTEAEGVVTLFDILHKDCVSLTDPQLAYMVPTP